MTAAGAGSAGDGVRELVATMDRLRSPGGCPWDAQQTHASLVPYALEEAYEVAEAIEAGSRADLREELGDLLLQVVFHARIAQEDPADPFDLDDVARGITAKLVRRHPHVFGADGAHGTHGTDGAGAGDRTAGGDADDADPAAGADVHGPDAGADVAGAGGADATAPAGDLHVQWDRIKRAEKQRTSVLDGVPLALGALARGQKVLGRARRAGLELTGAAAAGWRADAQVTSPADPAAAAWQEAEVGRRLLELVATADELGVDAESALRAAVRGVEQQVQRIEQSSGTQ
ncbi:MazG family protein [Cellulomonas cellasea]|uniref:XTP/dITP diphosphohydrolase n=1 Tax=Cellulomonas cellasea TaxID=43670 RepID=A0A7W4YBR5_9CELL|nr:MazG family protein [Cellulomonas cellasea]MBB2923948.1 XTP/dITP diphosphohydrolase [Cellulomonas cellasea]